LKRFNFEGIELIIPSDIDQFFYDYNHSKFLECSSKYAKESIQQMGNRYKINEETKNQFKSIKNVTSILEGLRKKYWLAAGTLLGKI
jgi:hypothetical protein